MIPHKATLHAFLRQGTGMAELVLWWRSESGPLTSLFDLDWGTKDP
jgi:hypothetical protein